MLTIVVYENNPIWLKRIGNTLNNNNNNKEYEIKLFDNRDNLLKYSKSHKPDIAYLDFQAGPSGNGLSLAKEIKMINKDALLIYITDSEEDYTETSQLIPFRFIKKEAVYNEAVIQNTLNDALNRLRSGFYFYSLFGKDYKLDLIKIKYIYSRWGKVYFVNENENNKYFYGKLNNVEKEITKIDHMFLRINRNTIINTRFLQHISKSSAELCGLTFKITNKYKKNFLKFIENNF